MAEWIPVAERLPEEKDRYLTVSIEPWFGTTVVDVMRWSGVWMYDGRQTEATVTHWKPLPEPPKEEHSPVYESLKRGLEQAINGETREEKTDRGCPPDYNPGFCYGDEDCDACWEGWRKEQEETE